MAAADTARLIASLELQDKFTKTADKALTKVDRIDKRLGAFSGAVNRNLARGVDTVITRGIQFLSGSITQGLEDLATLEDATRSADGAIQQMGLTGKVTSGQIAAWANEIETDVGAAFDDKDITAAAANLIRFGKVTEANLRPAMVVMTDLAVKTGSVESASSLLGKALADPTKAAGKLARVGIILTKAEQKKIAAFVKAGKVGKAQALILDSLSKSTEGAAEASQGKYRKALSLMADAGEDARKALAEGFLPVIERVAGKLTDITADPENMRRLRAFGKSLADVFDKAVDFAEEVDWKSIGDGLKTAAGWAKTLFDAFMSMPTEAKAAIFALAGLNKLTGGGVTGLVSELGRGLIKGVLGMNAGVVNLRAGVVNGGGGALPGGGGSKGRTGTLTGALKGIAKVTLVGIAAGVAIELAQALSDQSTFIQEQGKQLVETTKTNAPQMTEQELLNAMNSAYEQANGNLLNGFALLVTEPFNHGLSNLMTTYETLKAQLEALRRETGAGDERATSRIESLNKATTSGTKKLSADTRAEGIATRRAVTDQKTAVVRSQDAAKAAVKAAVAAGATSTALAASGAGSTVKGASISNTARIVGAINRIPAPIVNVRISAAQVSTSVTQQSRSSRESSRARDNVSDPF